MSRKSEWNMEQVKTENCMVCGTTLEYLKEATEVICNFCQKKEFAYILCPKGHYVCEQCHGKAALEVISQFVLTTKEKDPFSIAEVLMSHPQVPFLGCEHSSITAGSFLAALRNTDKIQIPDEKINSTLRRVQKQSIAGYCALNGCCGVAIGIGAAFGTIMGATCPKDRESAITMHAFVRVVEAIANDVGPMCCKSFVRTALGVGYNLAKEYLKIDLPIHRNIQCPYSDRNPSGCRESKCLYFPKAS